MPYEIEFYEDNAGRKPCLEWIRELGARERRVLGTALREILQQQEIRVCSSPFGKQLGEGLFEFRLREDNLLLRVFCHAYGNQIVLLLSGYDKGKHPAAGGSSARSPRRGSGCRPGGSAGATRRLEGCRYEQRLISWCYGTERIRGLRPSP